METFCWYVLLNKVFVDDICLEVVRASLKNLCELIGSPYNSIFFKKEVRQISICSCKIKGNYFKDKKTQKLQSLKRKHSKFFFIEKKTMWIDFIQIDPCKKIIERNNEVNFKYWGTQENKLSAIVTPWEKKCYLEIHWNQFHYWKSKIFFIQEKSTREIFVHRKTTEVDFFQGKVKNARGQKVRGNCFDSKKSMETNLDDFKTIKLNLSMKYPEVCSTEIDSMKFALIYGETRPNTISLTGTPDEPISYNCNASKLVFFKETPPISSIGNPRKFFSTTKMCWKSISSEKNLIHNLPWKNAHGKTSVDSFSL